MQGRVIKGFFAAAIMPVIVASVAALIYTATASPHIGSMARFALPTAIVIALPCAVAGILLIAVPAHYLASRLGRRSKRFYVLGGAVISLIVAAFVAFDVYRIPPVRDADMIFNALTVAVALISGPLSASAFWTVARPDRLTAPAPNP